MPVIVLVTKIKAPPARVFDLSRSIDLHQASMQHTHEKAVAGRTTALIENGEKVTWQAKHLFKIRSLVMHITAMKPYTCFTDEMLAGDFKMMQHEHHFEAQDGITTMKDIFRFEAPYGIVGKLFCKLYLTAYMTRLLQQRNLVIKDFAESDKWKMILPVEAL